MRRHIRHRRSLENERMGSRVWVEEIPDPPLLLPLGFRRGREVTPVMRQPLGGPLIVEVAGRRVAISREIARGIKVSDVGGAVCHAAAE